MNANSPKTTPSAFVKPAPSGSATIVNAYPETANADDYDFAALCADPVIQACAPVKIALLHGPVYSDEPSWKNLLRYRNDIQRFFAEIGVRLVIDEHDGYAFADQAPEGEPGSDWPRLYYRDRYSFDVTCVLIVLREWLLARESVPSDEHRPIRNEDLLENLRPFSRKKNAPVEKEAKRWAEAINKVQKYGFIKRVRDGEDSWEVRPIIRAKLPIETLKDLKKTLEDAAAGRASKSSSSLSDVESMSDVTETSPDSANALS